MPAHVPFPAHLERSRHMPEAPPLDRLPRALTVTYGLVAVIAFGTWFYGYGVLVSPIVLDTGWSEATLTTTYGLGMLASGIGAVLVGRVIDASGPRVVFLAGAAAVAAGTAVIATTSSPAVFVTGAVVTHCAVGATGYYTAVHASIARLAPADRSRAITVNTLWGAFASPVFLPLMALASQHWGWRGALVGAGGAVVMIFVVAGALTPAPDEPAPARLGLFGGLIDAGRDPVVRRLLVTAACGGVTTSVLFLYQVPAMVTAGLTLALASSLAGLRGVFQFVGRLPLPWLLRRVPSGLLFRASLVLIGFSSLLLLVSGHLLLAVLFVVLAGIGVGVFTTLESVYTAEVVEVRTIGLVLGAYAMARGVGSAIGPSAAGVLTDATGGRLAALTLGAAIAVVGALALPRRREAAAHS